MREGSASSAIQACQLKGEQRFKRSGARCPETIALMTGGEGGSCSQSTYYTSRGRKVGEPPVSG